MGLLSKLGGAVKEAARDNGVNGILNYTGNEEESDTRNCLTNKCYIQILESVNENLSKNI